MNKQKLREVTGLSSSSMAKLGKGESITTEMLVRICSKLDCDLTDIMELVDDNGEPVRNRIKKAEGELIYTPAIQSA
jgi:DNA-binding Xre family transcriptional regulator